MTFSDRRVIDLINDNFVAVWESVAPVKTATFDLGDGRELKGTVGGEIALYFCRPDGGVFDILPALQSPAVTYQAIESALAFYTKTEATLEATRRRHLVEAFKFGWKPEPMEVPVDLLAEEDQPRHREHLAYRLAESDSGTQALSQMLLSKVGMFTEEESITIVEPGGVDLYGAPIHKAFAGAEKLVPPDEWKSYLFELVLDQPLVGGDYRFDSTSLEPVPFSL